MRRLPPPLLAALLLVPWALSALPTAQGRPQESCEGAMDSDCDIPGGLHCDLYVATGTGSFACIYPFTSGQVPCVPHWPPPWPPQDPTC